MILPGYQTSDSASSSKFHHWSLLALLVALVLHWGESAISNLLSYCKIIALIK